MSMEAIYFDHNATTALDARVLEAMLPYLRGQQGNPTSRHGFGRTARQAIDLAREQVAAAVGAHPSQVTFTSGGTEANNTAIKGIAATHTPAQLVCSAIEHPAVSKPMQSLLGRGWKMARTPVDQDGKVNLAALETLLQQKTALVSVMLANNETGVLQDIPAIAGLARRHGALLHTDAVQALGKVAVDFTASGANAMSLSGHKIHGPQGVGALILDKRVDLQPLLEGGGQEKGLRSGTENIAAIVGFGMACELVTRDLERHAEKIRGLRDQFEQGLVELGATVFGQGAERLPNTSFFALPNIEGETLVMALDRQGYAVASGSACSSDSIEPSHVLLAMGIAPEVARGAVRVSLGARNSAAQVDALLQALKNEQLRMKRMAAVAV